MDDEAIDRAILSVLADSGGRWRKVAFVVAGVADASGADLADGGEIYKRVGRRIEVLVREGRLIVQGDVANWRHSEVRAPS